MDENQVLCIDDKYEGDTLAFWRQYGVNYPKLNAIYSIRDIIKHTERGTGLLLMEIENPKVPINHPILGVTMMEPTFKVERFAHLNGDPLTLEEVREIIRSSNLTKLLNF